MIVIPINSIIETYINIQLQSDMKGSELNSELELIAAICELHLNMFRKRVSNEAISDFLNEMQTRFEKDDWKTARSILWLAYIQLLSGIPTTLIGITANEKVLSEYIHTMKAMLA